MTKSFNRLLFCILLVGLTSVWAVAQDSDSDKNANSKDQVSHHDRMPDEIRQRQ